MNSLKRNTLLQTGVCLLFCLMAVASFEPKKKSSQTTPNPTHASPSVADGSGREESEQAPSRTAHQIEAPGDADGSSSFAKQERPRTDAVAQGGTSEQSRARAMKMKEDLKRLDQQMEQLAAKVGQGEYSRLLGETEGKFRNLGDALDKSLSPAEKQVETRVAILNMLAMVLEKQITEKESAASAAKTRLVEAKGELSAVNTRIDAERARYQAALEVINRLTNFKRTPVQEGSRAYYQCLEASKIIQEVEAGAPRLKEERARLQTVIDEIQSSLSDR
jgi:chromosome segregation ATPase